MVGKRKKLMMMSSSVRKKMTTSSVQKKTVLVVVAFAVDDTRLSDEESAPADPSGVKLSPEQPQQSTGART